ncbi:DUF2478 domain-containing protein [Thioclava sp. FR2]|uniref:DUF2478 domain-containing protein n=1 Tax=Thioclava sp. FR2 TaxID=3445780 RepID=UPI003EC03180
MKFAYVIAAENGAVNRALSGLAMQLLDEGVRVVGTTQHDTPRPRTHVCDMDVRVLPDGDVIRISQDLGPNSRGCRLDAGALEEAVAATMARLDGAELLVINKFGKHEADGRGFREVIAEAISRDIPVIVGTNGLNVGAFKEFCGDQAVPLAADTAVLLDWARPLLRRAA